MGKKLGLDEAYKNLNLTTGVHKNSILNKINLSKSTSMKAYDSTKMLTNSIALGIKKPSKLTLGKKVLNIGKKVLGRTPVGRAVNLAVNVGSGIGIGYSYAKNKFKGKSETKVDKKSAGGEMNQMNIKGYMGGGASRGYGAARTSGMGLQDESLMPGKMVRAKNGKMLSAKQKKIARMAPPRNKITGADFKAMKAKNGKMVKARFGDFMNTFIADDKRSVAGKSGGADSGTAGEIRSRLGKSDVVEKKKFKNYIKKKVEQGKTVIKKTKETVKKTGKILAIPFKKIDEVAKKNIEENGPVRIYRPRTAVKRYSKGGGMDMGAKKSLTFRQQLTKARADNTRPEDAEKSLTLDNS